MGIAERKERDFYRRERDILKAALSLFRGDDWQLVTVEEIAQKAEIGKGTVYKHFDSKDQIYARLVLDFQRDVLGKMRKVDTNLPVTARFAAMTRVAWEAHLASKELHRLMLYCGRAEFRKGIVGEMAEEWALIDAETNKLVYEVVQRGVDEGIFPRRPPEKLLFGARAAFWGAVQLVWSGYFGAQNHATYLQEITNFILAGLIYQDQITV